jgi:hypothetical protein
MEGPVSRSARRKVTMPTNTPQPPRSMNRWVAAAGIAALLIAGLFGSPAATSADDWDMKINGGVAQLLP